MTDTQQFKKGDKVQIKRDFQGIIGTMYGGVNYDEIHEDNKGKPLEISMESEGVGHSVIYMVKVAGEDTEFFVSPEMIECIDGSRIIDAEEVIATDTPAQKGEEKKRVEFPPDIREDQKMSHIIKTFKEKHWDKFKSPEDFRELLYDYVDMKDLLR